jgi:hypothetical protein
LVEKSRGDKPFPCLFQYFKVYQVGLGDRVGLADQVDLVDQVGLADQVDLVDQVGLADQVDLVWVGWVYGLALVVQFRWVSVEAGL